MQARHKEDGYKEAKLIVELLLERDFDINAKDRNGNTALLSAKKTF